jgi:hypothetical protein
LSPSPPTITPSDGRVRLFTLFDARLSGTHLLGAL